jgi:transposase
MSEYYVGLDVHSKQSVFVIEDREGTVRAEGAIPSTPTGFRQLQERYALPAGTPVGLETGTVAFFAARQLLGVGLAPTVIDAHEVRLKAHRPTQKSDRRDAYELCEGLRRGIYRILVHVPPLAVAQLRESLSRRRHFVRVQTAEINAAKRLLRADGLSHLSRTLTSAAGWAKLLRAEDVPSEGRAHLERHHALWREAGAQITALEAQLQTQREAFAIPLERLQQIPGVGPIVAATAVAVFSTIGRFPSAKHAASYAGLVPSTYQSGQRDAHGHITKRGSAELRAMLCEAAHHARRPTHPLHPYFAAQCAKGGYKKAVVAVAHRLARIIFAMLRDETEFDVRKLRIDVGPFTTTTVRPYRLKPLDKGRRRSEQAP